MSCNTVNLLCDTSAGLVCNTTAASGCSCPTTLNINICDCPITKYWDGSKCVFRGTYGDYCTQTYMCTANVGLICNATSNVCKCDSAHKYWDTSVSYCRNIFINLFHFDAFFYVKFFFLIFRNICHLWRFLHIDLLRSFVRIDLLEWKWN